MKAMAPGSLRHRSSSHLFKTDTGMALLLCMLFLTVLTLQGLSASAETIMQGQLAANLHESERARQSALATQEWAESWLVQLDGSIPEICSQACGGLKIHAAGSLPSHPEFEDLSWWMDQGHEAGIDPLTGDRISTISVGSINPSMWIIEAVHEIPPMKNGNADLQSWYRILARGSGRTNTSVSVVESIVMRSWVSIGSVDVPGTAVPGLCPGAEPAAKCGRVAWRELR
jgi:Tfp pilus assembly protein PilX